MFTQTLAAVASILVAAGLLFQLVTTVRVGARAVRRTSTEAKRVRRPKREYRMALRAAKCSVK